jgi:hypothetical protein
MTEQQYCLFGWAEHEAGAAGLDITNAPLTAENSFGGLGSTPSENGPQKRDLDRLAAQTIALHLRIKSLSRRGHLYEVALDGEVIVPSSRDPEPDACRELLRRGLRGVAVFCRAGVPCLRMDIERGAQLMTKESGEGVRYVKFTPDGASIGEVQPVQSVWALR